MQVGVIGCGTMGQGIAQVAATASCPVLVYDLNPDALVKGEKEIERILNRSVEKGRIDAEKKKLVLANIQYVNTFHAMQPCDIIIEAIVEDAMVKDQVIKQLEPWLKEDCIFASNTSSISITLLAASCEKPSRFLGIHFFNPAPLMKLVEIVPGVQTDPTVVNDAEKIIKKWGKHTVIAKDTPGFIVNKVARPFYGEALRIYDEGIADVVTIDWAMREIGGFRMGPFELMDFIGNDINYAVTETIFKSFYNDPRYKPSFTQKRLAEAGYLGRKTGRGYYQYDHNTTHPSPTKDMNLGKQIVERIVMMLINEAADTLHYNIASLEDIDLAMTKGVNYPKGLFVWADEIGLTRCVQSMDALYEEYHEARYRCSPLLRNMAKENHRFYPQNIDA